MKRIAILAIVVVGLAGLALLAVPLLLAPDILKQRIAERISSATGRTVTLTGDPSLSIYPHVAVGVGGVRIANPPGMGDDPFIVAKGLSARLRLLPLLLGRTEFDSFELVEPRIHLVADDRGRVNWRLERRPAGSKAPVASDIALGRLQVSNGAIVYDNLAGKRHEEMTGVDLDIAWPTAAAAASGSGTLQWRGETVEFNGSVTKPLDLIASGGSPVRFAIASTPLRVAFNGKALLDDYRVEGEASVTTPSLRRAIEWLGTPMGNGSILGPASIKGTIGWVGPTMSFSKASIELDGNGAEGVVAVNLAGDRPAVTGTLAFGKLDLSPYVEAMRADMGAEGSWLFAPTSLPIANAIDADLRLSSGEVLIGTARIGRAAAAATIKDGRATVDIGEAQFYGGRLEARLSAAMVDKTLVGSARAKVSGVPARTALSELIAVSGLSGTATAGVDISGRGRSWGEFAQSMAGTAVVDIADGSVTGIDVGEVAARMIDPLAEPLRGSAGSTSFARLAGTLAIEGGALRADNLTVEGRNYRVAFSGRGSLLTGFVEAKAKLSMMDGGGKSRETIPLAITGTWREPVIAPDQPGKRSDGLRAVHAPPPG